MPNNTTVGDIRKLSKQPKKDVSKQLFKTGAHLRNSPGFFDRRKQELIAMCQQLGDPHAFATNSHADTYCPYVARFIMAMAKVPSGGARDPFLPGLRKHEQYERRRMLMVEHPHLTAYFFHLKTQLYLEHVCVGIMGADAWWSRYEWQSRGSTHAHYFLWFRDAPDVSFLEDWTQQAMADVLKEGNGEAELGEEQLFHLVEALNERALAASADSPDAQDRMASEAVQYWAARCSRWNEAWLTDRNEPDRVGEPHPSSELHLQCQPCEDDPPGKHGVSKGANRWQGRLLNATNRHSTHTDYCLRKDKHGNTYCRFHFPQTPRPHNDRPYFYCEEANGGVRWRLYLPMNDPDRNTVSHWQAFAQRSNVDFQPLIDHFAALEYMVKYASKEEKGSSSFDSVLNVVLRRSEESLPDDASARRVYAAVLSQVVGGRNWSAQEVGHVNLGCRTVLSSHEFETVYLAGKRKRLRPDITTATADDEPAFSANALDKYFGRIDACASSNLDVEEDQTTLLEHGFEGRLDPFRINLDHVGACSFTDFWRTYRTTSDGPNKGKFRVLAAPHMGQLPSTAPTHQRLPTHVRHRWCAAWSPPL